MNRARLIQETSEGETTIKLQKKKEIYQRHIHAHTTHERKGEYDRVNARECESEYKGNLET